MIDRKKKLRIIQAGLLLVGSLMIIFTYTNQKRNELSFLSEKNQEIVKNELTKEDESGDIFYNIEYSGLDLDGNRYIIASKEATNDDLDKNIVYMKEVNAKFYLKDNTILKIKSNNAIYNNQSLNMKFSNDVIADYEGSRLLAGEAEFSNEKSVLIISNKVRITDKKGTMQADRLLFDIKQKTLNIESLNENKINTNINLK